MPRTKEQLRARMADAIAQRYGTTVFDLQAKIPQGKRPSEFLTETRIKNRRTETESAYSTGIIRPGEKLPNGRTAPNDGKWTVGYWIKRGSMLMFQRDTSHDGTPITKENASALCAAHLAEMVEESVEAGLLEDYLVEATADL